MPANVESLIADLRSVVGSDLVGFDRGEPPRFLLCHAANSICSQKVRVVFAHHRIGYASCQLNIFKGQTYLPGYVRLRLIGCEASGLALVGAHSGSTAVSAGGCDPAVVPTLVDLRTGRVVVDSKVICIYVDALFADEDRLRPAALADAIDAELDIVDNLPNYQMLAGRAALGSANFAMSKVERCDRYLEEFAADASLVRAYGAKRAKELDAARTLFSQEAMELANARAEAACERLDARLAAADGRWLFGTAVTLADLLWAVELQRLKNLGAGRFWEQGKLAAVQAFVAATEELPCIRSAILEWPGALF